MNFSGKHSVSQSDGNPAHNPGSEVSTYLSEVLKQLQLMNNNFMSTMPNPGTFNFNPQFGHFPNAKRLKLHLLHRRLDL